MLIQINATSRHPTRASSSSRKKVGRIDEADQHDVVRHLSVVSFERGSGVSPCKRRHAFWIDLIPKPICALMQINLSIRGGMPLQRSFLALLDRVCPTRVRGRKSHPEQIWSALPQIADIDFSREDFSVGPNPDLT
jgi:hypothetical protein